MEWISVNDRLPAVSLEAKDFQLASGESDQVLIVMGGVRFIATYHVNIEKWNIPFHHGEWKPTLWMPLPALPKAKFPSIEKQPTQSDFEALQTVQDVLTDEQALEALK